MEEEEEEQGVRTRRGRREVTINFHPGSHNRWARMQKQVALLVHSCTNHHHPHPHAWPLPSPYHPSTLGYPHLALSVSCVLFCPPFCCLLFFHTLSLIVSSRFTLASSRILPAYLPFASYSSCSACTFVSHVPSLCSFLIPKTASTT